MMSSHEAKRKWKVTHLLDGGGSPGPHGSSNESFRSEIRNTFLCPHLGSGRDPLREYTDWPTPAGAAPVPDALNANRKRPSLLCENYIQNGDPLGERRAYDSVSDSPWGQMIIQNSFDQCAAEGGLRDNGFGNGNVGGSGYGGPEILHQIADPGVPIWGVNPIGYTWAFETQTRDAGAGGFGISFGRNEFEGQGIRVVRNQNIIAAIFSGGSGLSTQISNYTGPNINLAPSTKYRIVLGLTRSGSSGGTLTMRFYDSSGVFLFQKTTVSGNGPYDAARGECLIKRATYLRVYPGVNHASNPAIADAIADHSVIDPGGMAFNTPGVRTGVFDPDNPSRLIFTRTSAVTSEIAFPRRCRWASENKVVP